MKDMAGEERSEFSKRRETTDTSGMLRILSDRTLDIDDGECSCSQTDRRYLTV